jgi:hypothetical protein
MAEPRYARSEVVYRVPSVDFDRIVADLRERQQVKKDLEVRYDSEAGPPGICYVYLNSAIAHIGSKGGIQIHYETQADHDRLLRVLTTIIGVPVSKWTKTKERLGTTHYKKLNSKLAGILGDETEAFSDLLDMPGIDSTKSSIEDRIAFISARFTRLTYFTALSYAFARVALGDKSVKGTKRKSK